MDELSDQTIADFWRVACKAKGSTAEVAINFARSIIAADRALNAAPSVGAEGLPPMPKAAMREMSSYSPREILEWYDADQMRAYALAALASRPAVEK